MVSVIRVAGLGQRGDRQAAAFHFPMQQLAAVRLDFDMPQRGAAALGDQELALVVALEGQPRNLCPQVRWPLIGWFLFLANQCQPFFRPSARVSKPIRQNGYHQGCNPG